jgi:hypothetical protein
MDDDEALAGGRESRRRCAFCDQRGDTIVCDGDRCIRQICAEHRTSRGRLEFCPVCEPKARAIAATPEQMTLFA